MRIVLTFLFVCIFWSVTFSQAETLIENNSLIEGNTITYQFSLTNTMAHSNNEAWKMVSGAGGVLGVYYTYRVQDLMCVRGGLESGIQTFGFQIENKDFKLNKIQYLPQMYFSMPISIINQWHINNRNFLTAQFGASANFYLPAYLDNELILDNGNVLDQSINIQNRRDISISGIIGFGWVHQLKNSNLLEIGIKNNIGFTEIVKGNYVNKTSETSENEGFYTKGTQFALTVAYSFGKIE